MLFRSDLNVIIFGICGLAQLAIAKRHLTLTQLLVPLLVCLFLIWILIYIECKVMNIGSLPASNYRPQPAWMPVGGLIMSQAMAWAVLINVIGYFGISDNDAA